MINAVFPLFFCHANWKSPTRPRGYCFIRFAKPWEIGAPTEGGKRGRGTDQTPVLVGESLNKQGAPQYVKMQVIPDVKGKTLVEFAKQHIEPGSTISSDAYRSYNALAEEYKALRRQHR